MKILLLSTLILLCSCSKQRELVGTWKVTDYTLWERGIGFLKGVRGLEMGTELTLNADSTFREKTCGNIIVGKWTQEGDSLVLNSDTMWYRAAKWYREHEDMNYDSIAGIRSHEREPFLIKHDKFIRYYKSYSENPDGSKGLEHSSMAILKRESTN